MKQIEKVIQCRDPKRFIEEVNRECEAGWTVKPQTWSVATISKVPGPNTPAHVVMPSGVALDCVYFVTLISPPTPSNA